MSQHVRLRQEAGADVYFCEPQSPWQRGTNENTNGLLRQYFPKGTDLSLHGVDDLAAVAATLNARPRKVLGWRTPNEVFEQVLYGIELKVRGQAAGSQWKLVRFETRACCCISQTHH